MNFVPEVLNSTAFFVALALAAMAIMVFLWKRGDLHALIIFLIGFGAIFFGLVFARVGLQVPPVSLPVLENDLVYARANYLTNTWRTVSIFWRCGDFCLLAMPFALTGFILYSAMVYENPRKVDFFCSLAILILGIAMYIIGPAQQTRCYRRAYVELYAEMLHYEAEAMKVASEPMGIPTEAQDRLEDAIRRGEEIINATYYLEDDMAKEYLARGEAEGQRKARLEVAHRMREIGISEDDIAKVITSESDTLF